MHCAALLPLEAVELLSRNPSWPPRCWVPRRRQRKHRRPNLRSAKRVSVPAGAGSDPEHSAGEPAGPPPLAAGTPGAGPRRLPSPSGCRGPCRAGHGPAAGAAAARPGRGAPRGPGPGRDTRRRPPQSAESRQARPSRPAPRSAPAPAPTPGPARGGRGGDGRGPRCRRARPARRLRTGSGSRARARAAAGGGRAGLGEGREGGINGSAPSWRWKTWSQRRGGHSRTPPTPRT